MNTLTTHLKTCKRCGFAGFAHHFIGRICRPCKSVAVKAGFVYLLRDVDDIKSSYKIGMHTGTRDALIKRYKTYFPHVEILRFRPVERARMVENYIHTTLSFARIGKSEWFQADESTVVLIFDECMDEYS